MTARTKETTKSAIILPLFHSYLVPPQMRARRRLMMQGKRKNVLILSAWIHVEMRDSVLPEEIKLLQFLGGGECVHLFAVRWLEKGGNDGHGEGANGQI